MSDVNCTIYQCIKYIILNVIYIISTGNTINFSWSKSWCPGRNVPVQGNTRCLVCFCQLIITTVSTLSTHTFSNQDQEQDLVPCLFQSTSHFTRIYADLNVPFKVAKELCFMTSKIRRSSGVKMHSLAKFYWPQYV